MQIAEIYLTEEMLDGGSIALRRRGGKQKGGHMAQKGLGTTGRKASGKARELWKLVAAMHERDE